ncbi:glycosyltransferase family 4 protein [Alphaproteobacteria bacterium]|nr:glycosyltransferase family 4 protein [Alphaproteobacteria bacterium]
MNTSRILVFFESSGMKRRLVFVVNSLDSFESHRFPIAVSALKEGYDVFIVYGESRTAKLSKFVSIGIKLIKVSGRRGSTNIFLEVIYALGLFSVVRKLKPDLIHLITLKPILYGGIAAWLCSVPALVIAVTGMGSIIIKRSLIASAYKALIRSALRIVTLHPNHTIIVQNIDDKADLIAWGVAKSKNVRLIAGSGVDLGQFCMTDERDEIPVVTFLGRLIKDKGFNEFVDAVRILRNRGILARFWVVGSPDYENPTSVSKNELEKLSEENVVELLGYRENVNEIYKETNIVCLPSYREGLPKSLIEAAACGRSIVTTDVPGCRDAITPDVTGFLVPAKAPNVLADKIQTLIENPNLRKQMGGAGRALAEKTFAIEKIVSQHLEIYKDLQNE